MVQVVEHLSGKHKILNLNSTNSKRKTRRPYIGIKTIDIILLIRIIYFKKISVNTSATSNGRLDESDKSMSGNTDEKMREKGEVQRSHIKNYRQRKRIAIFECVTLSFPN
jgi:hypothetical protein